MPTKLLLIEDVDSVGRSGDVVTVKPGFARNFLVPQGRAVVASKYTLRMQEKLQQERAKKAAEDKKDAEKQAKQLADVTVETKVKTDAAGHMYGSVSALDIVNLVGEQAKIELDRRSVLLKHPIKALGIHRIELRLTEGVEASVQVKVMNEEGEIPAPKKTVEEEDAPADAEAEENAAEEQTTEA